MRKLLLAAVLITVLMYTPPAMAARDGIVTGVYSGNIQENGRSEGNLEKYIARYGEPHLTADFKPWKWRGQYVGFNARGYNQVLKENKGNRIHLTWEPDDTSRDGRCKVAWQNRDILAGKHDAYIRSFARDAARWGKPIHIRLGHEMNTDSFPWGVHCPGNTVGSYKRMFNHVVRVFNQQGAHNVRWVAAPHSRHTIDDQRALNKFIPSGADIAGYSWHNWGTVNGNQWTELNGMLRRDYATLARTGLPIELSEGGTTNVGGNQSEWIDRARRDLKRYPKVRYMVYFSQSRDGAKWDLLTTRAKGQAWQRLLNDPYFQRG